MPHIGNDQMAHTQQLRCAWPQTPRAPIHPPMRALGPHTATTLRVVSNTKGLVSSAHACLRPTHSNCVTRGLKHQGTPSHLLICPLGRSTHSNCVTHAHTLLHSSCKSKRKHIQACTMYEHTFIQAQYVHTSTHYCATHAHTPLCAGFSSW